MKKSILFSFLSSVILILVLFSASSLLFADKAAPVVDKPAPVEQPATIEQPAPVEQPATVEQVAPVEQVWVRDHPMTCYQVWVNKDNNFEFVFWWEYKSNNWVKIYDMAGKEVFSIDMPYGDAHFIANLPDGMYTVKTFHDGFEKPIQKFVIGKPTPEHSEGYVDVAVFRAFSPVLSEGGIITVVPGRWDAVRTFDILVGDSLYNNPIKGYISFDITGLEASHIHDVSVIFYASQILGHPTELGTIFVRVVDWGTGSIVNEDIDLTGELLFSSRTVDGDFTVWVSSLETALKNAITAGKTRFQLQIHMSPLDTNGNNATDAFVYRQSASSGIYLRMGIVY